MSRDLKEKYYISRHSQGVWEDVTEKFDGLRILKIGGYNELGKTQNVYTAKWIDSQSEDFEITTLDYDSQPMVIRENVDIEITFIVSRRYAKNFIDVRTQHDAFISYLTSSDVYIRSKYVQKKAHCVNLDGYKPTTENLNRGVNSYIMGTIKMHTLDMPEIAEDEKIGDVYIGFGASVLSSETDITSLANVQHFNKNDASGSYSFVCPSTSYLWICTQGAISGVVSSGFEVPINSAIVVGEYRCYRSCNTIIQGTMNFSVITT